MGIHFFLSIVHVLAACSLRVLIIQATLRGNWKPSDQYVSFFVVFVGDSRVNELPQLTVVQTIWMREHNRIAKILTNLNPTWSREVVFQETRRIVIAELQHITYNEFLPTLLGIKKFK